jgi:hypothetical protein
VVDMDGLILETLPFVEETEGTVDVAENDGGGLRWTEVGEEAVGDVVVAWR